GWADLAGFRRYSIRPRIWWSAGADRSVFVTGGVTEGRREGGTLLGRALPDGAAFAESLHPRRLDGGHVGNWKLVAAIGLASLLSITSTDLDRTFGQQRVASSQTTIFSEQAFTGSTPGQQWAVGLAFEHEALRVPAVPGVGYTYNVPGLFAQDEFSP